MSIVNKSLVLALIGTGSFIGSYMSQTTDALAECNAASADIACPLSLANPMNLMSPNNPANQPYNPVNPNSPTNPSNLSNPNNPYNLNRPTPNGLGCLLGIGCSPPETAASVGPPQAATSMDQNESYPLPHRRHHRRHKRTQ